MTIPETLPHRYPGGLSPAKLTQDVVAALQVMRAANRKGNGWLRKQPGWGIIPLRSRGGTLTDPNVGTPSRLPWRDSRALDAAPTFQLARAEAEMRTGMKVASMRLSCLEPGARTSSHCDNGNHLRIHVPITTSERAYVDIAGVRWHWGVGEMWIADFSAVHCAVNDGDKDRVHLLMVLE